MVTFPEPARPLGRIAPLDFPSRPSIPAPDPGLETAYAAGLLLAIGTLDLPFAFFGRGGEVLHASPAFRRCLEEDALPALEREVRRFARAMWGAANVRRLGQVVTQLEERSASLECGGCRLQGTYVGVDLFGQGGSVLVGVRLPPADHCSSDRLQARFGLTRKQSRVAQLLVEGLRNDEIAKRLFISPHTARHHVEQIRLKVGGHTRAAVAARIFQADAAA